MAEHPHSAGLPETETLRSFLSRASSQPLQTLFHELGSRPHGLGAREAQAQRKKFGLNVPAHEQRPPWWIHLWRCFRHPFNLLLSALALVSALTDSAGSAGTIVAMVTLSTALRFVQETRAKRQAMRFAPGSHIMSWCAAPRCRIY